LELKLHRYQFSSTNNDRYTWQGKEDLEADNLEGWSDFGWRIEDRTLGRWFTPDPEDQFESVSTYALCLNNPVSHIDPDGRILPILIPIIAGVVGGGLNVATNWSKIQNPLQALGFFATGAAGGVVSLGNPLAGGAITTAGNAAIDIASGNIPNLKNVGDALAYIGKEAAFGAATSFAGAQAGKIIGPALSKLGNSVGGWFQNSFQTYAKESLQTVIINGQSITTTIEAGIKATKTYVSKALGSSVGSATKTGGRVFWSGEGAMNTAMNYAKSTGGTTLEMTRAGQNLQNLIRTRNIPWAEARPMWQRLSTVYAKGANGTVHFFPGTTVNPGSIWLNTEKNILLQNGVNIITH
jgi:RHS repeat-associated protein